MTDSPAPIRILLVDDDPMVRTGLAMILGGDPRLEVVGEAVDGLDALDAVARWEPDVVLMDIRMPRLDGLGATEQLLGQPNPPKIIVLTTFDTDELVLRALRLGARGFMLKDTPPARIVEAVRAVAAGEPILSPSVTATLIATVTAGEESASAARARARAALDELTEREREVAIAIGRGLSNADIAADLYMSVATVKAHVGRLFTKLAADNRVQVAILVHEAELT
ncbi:response regulator [Millisia brevis]|uniref:response regulator n=1 Tax=Millisia brevis TaxID=264148 RepID=UPI0024802F2F|nr:response regulator transcription factor [Millisia brevis]